MLISGQIGPRGDGYTIDTKMTINEAQDYHQIQVDAFKNAGVDMVTAITMTHIEEAIGIVRAASNNEVPVVISFTVETNGRLPSGQSIGDAISDIDLITDSYPLYYMINCAHPSHFYNQLEENSEWIKRIKGIRANASCKSHAELDESLVLDRGDVEELGQWHQLLMGKIPNLVVFGGCCGTDSTHIHAIANRNF